MRRTHPRRAPLAVAAAVLALCSGAPVSFAQAPKPSAAASSPAPAADGLKMTREITIVERAAELQPGSGNCRQLQPQMLQKLTLIDALEHVLCKSPLLNQALLLVDEQQAGVDLARSAYRPQLALYGETSANRIPASNSGSGALGASVTGSLGLTWTLFDFGVRDANLEQARQTLNSARAGTQTATLAAINQTLQLYVDAAGAQARLDAAREAETVARQGMQVADGKYTALVASLAEKLQAQTAFAQANLERVRAEGNWDIARGVLAVGMGFPVRQDITLAPADSAFPSADVSGSIAVWIDGAKAEHPRVRGLRAEVLALQSRLDSIRAGGKGSVALSVDAASTRDLRTPGAKFEHSLNGYAVATIPIFNGAQQNALEGQAVAQIESRRSALLAAERDIEADLWRNARLMDTEAQNLQASKLLMEVADKSYQINFGRYKSGVGSILELIAAQVALANARSQFTQAQLGYAQARLRLVVAAGGVALRN